MDRAFVAPKIPQRLCLETCLATFVENENPFLDLIDDAFFFLTCRRHLVDCMGLEK